MSKPVAVLISDIHYNLANLALADAALRQAIQHANRLKVPLIVAGDIHDTKAMLRGECINAMLDTWATREVPTFVIVGNHDRINERSPSHSLEFLRDHTQIVDVARYFNVLNGMWLVPYHSQEEDLAGTLSRIPVGATVICHQGIQGAFMGEYVVDKSAVPTELFENFRTLSGHYHRAQDIKASALKQRDGQVGMFSYIGTPYTITFAEANDGPKGFRVLMDDGTLDFVPTNLRKHVIIETELSFLNLTLGVCANQVNPGDLIWLKLKGSTTELSKVNKEELGQALFGHANYKLERIYTDAPALEPEQVTNKTGEEILDNLIDSSDDSKEQKEHLKSLWKEIL